MKKTALAVLILLACAAPVLAGEIAFVDNYDQALQIAGDKSRNMLITFYTDW